MGLYDTIAGTADHLAGSVDESVGRQFDDTEGGGFADTIQDVPIVTEHRENDDFVFTGLPRLLGDTVMDYDSVNYQDDTVDLPGPAVGDGELFDPGEYIPDPEDDPFNLRQWVPLLVVALLAYGFLTSLATGIGQGLVS